MKAEISNEDDDIAFTALAKVFIKYADKVSDTVKFKKIVTILRKTGQNPSAATMESILQNFKSDKLKSVNLPTLWSTVYPIHWETDDKEEIRDKLKQAFAVFADDDSSEISVADRLRFF
ncbi:hypothetical protein GJ496_011116 [Pomphorhynchus laevis]|nr:hypothetical protein GJ496_011116 [Pomphorhynchus laevis]